MIAKRRLHQIVSFFVALTMVLQMLGVPLAPQATASVIGETGMDAALETSSEHVAAITAAASATTEPDVLVNPLSVSRVQSTYQTGANATITYTVSNNQVPTRAPALGSAATVTESANILADFVVTDDMNTLRDVSLATTLDNGATYVSSTHPPAQNGNTFNWDLADIQPGATAVFTLTVQPPATSPDFTELDSGATVDATLWDTAVSHQARPILLAPDAIDPAALAATPDADPYDEDMLWQTAAFTQDPLGIFQYVQSMRYDPYAGSLRGTRGTLWGAAGNSLDQTSLLIAALRAAGIPARYRHGTLSTADAQTLLASAFPTTKGAAGYLPDGAETADPLNDAALIAVAQDHWWTEAYLPGQGWTDLDPSFPGATVDQAVAVPTNDGSDQISELPDAVHHTLTLSLVVEQYTQFPVDGTFLQESVPLSATLPTAQVAGRRVILSQFVEDNVPAGAVFATREIVYQPYFGIPETGQAFLGDTFQDILSNFPFSTRATTAVWLHYQIADPAGESESFERPIKDLIGPDVRLTGGEPDLAFESTSPPFLTPDEQYVNWVLPNDVPEWAYRRRVIPALLTTLQLGQRMQETLAFLDVPTGTELTAEQLDDLVGAAGAALSASTESLALTGLNFATKADRAVDAIESGLHTRLFYSSPRLFAVGTTLPISGSAEATVDLRTTRATALVAPGQSARAGQTAQWLKGIVESELEGAVLEGVYDAPAVTTANVFARMENAGVEPVLIQPDQIHLLDLYSFSPEGKAHMLDALLAGKWVLAPEQPITINGEDALAWWEFDPNTGETISVGEDGLHTAAINWRIVEMLVEELVTQLLEFLLGFLLDNFSGGTVGGSPSPTAIIQMAEMFEEIGNSLNELFLGIADVLSESAMNAPQQISEISEASSGWAYLPAHLCPVDNCGVEQFFFDTAAVQPIPLPEMTFACSDGAPADPVDVAARNVTATLPPGDPTLALVAAPASSATAPGSSVSFQTDIATNVDDTFTTIAYAPDDWVVTVDAGGTVNAQPPLTAVASDHTILIVTQSQSHPDLIASAIHTVSVTPAADLSVSATAEPNLTVSLGDAAFAAVSNQTNDGEAEIPDAAWRLTVTNFRSQAESITIDVSGAPAGWTILNGARQERTTFTLDANAQAQIGLYLLPSHVPAPGTSFDLTVEVDNGNGATESVILPWSMPGQAHNYLQVIPETLYAEIGGSVDFDLFMANVGNAAGTFPISVTSPLTATVSNLQSPMSLEPDESDTQTPTLTVADGEVGRRYPLLFASTAPDSYTQYAPAELRIVSASTGAVFSAADSVCTQAEPGLSPTLETLAIAMTDLENACGSGDCPPVLRDQVVEALEGVIAYAGLVSPLVTADDALQIIAGDVAAHDDNADIEADLAAIGPAVADLEAEVCEIGEHAVALSWSPAYEATLPGQPATYTLNVENQGTVTTTYAITLDLPSGQNSFEDTIPAGSTATYDSSLSESDLGLYELSATVGAVGPDVSLTGIGDEATAHLNVVERFVQVTAVTADPAFVETGTSATSVSVDIANVANVARPATAHTEVVAPGGGISYTANVPLTILAGAPRTHDLSVVDTSGWAAGAYTITVDLLDEGGSLMSSGYGPLGVGQALGAAHAVGPTLVAPGTSTVTTTITTTILGETAVSPSTSASALPWQPAGLRQAGDEPDVLAEEDEGSSNTGGETVDTRRAGDLTDDATSAEARPDEEAQDEAPLPAPSILPSPNTVIGTVILRHEEDEALLTGSWTTAGSSRASSGNYIHSDTAGDSATFTFSGSWVHLGFLANRYSGEAEVFIDGGSQGVIDLYRRDEMPVSFVYSGLGGGSHTLSVTVLGSANPHAGDTDVRLDYLDAWDGSAFANGVFEQDDARVFGSTGWSNVADEAASSGTYMRDDAATAWFPFTGDSVTYQALAYSGGGKVRISIDGVYQTTLDLYHPLASITRTLSFDGLGSGPHVLQVSTYRGNATVDAFATPGAAPFFTPPTPSGFTRFEEDNPAFLYNGVPFTATAQTWTRHSHVYYSEASDGQRIYSRTAGDTASLTFDGEWVSVGFFTDHDSGMAEIYLDGASMGSVDLYSNEDDVTSFSYDVAPGAHTISVTVLGTSNPLASDNLVHLDYVDTWDGSNLSTGRFEQTDGRVLRSGGWSDVANGDTSGGSYSEAVLHGEPTAWFPFTGDSVTYQAYDYFHSDEVAIYIDEVFQGYYDIRTGNAPTLTHSFDGLGSGLHVLKVRDYRAEATLDAFVTPAVSPPTPPPTPAVFTRHEEDDPAIRYNGLPYTTTAESWNRYDGVGRASDGQFIRSGAPGDRVSFDFNGPWVGIGFATDRFGGRAEVFIDGVSQGVIDFYSREDDVASFTYDGLADTTHTISATILSTANPYAGGARMAVDYFDTWTGDPLPAGTYEESHPLVIRSDYYDDWGVFAETAASGGSYMSDDFFSNDGTVWFPFTGDSITFLGFANGDADQVRISIDGVSQGAFNLYGGTPMTRALSFDGLGSGPHVMEVRHYKGEPNVDAFIAPGIPPSTETPVHTGVVRYEEDDPALVYNGDADFRAQPQSWVLRKTWTIDSGGWHVYSGAAGDTISLTFDGRWAGIGFLGRNGTSEAEVFIDGVSQGVLDLDNGGSDELFHSFGNLITGTHTLSVSVVSGYVTFDYIDVWDGQPTPEATTNIRRAEDSGRLYYSTNIRDRSHPGAIEGDFVGVPIFNFPANLWYNFVGDSFTFYYFSERNGGSVNVYVDGQFVETVSQDYEFSPQPFGVSYDGFGEGPHVVRVESVSAIRADAFRSPADPLPYMPSVEWFDTTPNGGTGAFGTPAGAIMGMAAGDVDGDGATEIVLPSDTFAPDTSDFVNSIFIFRGDGADTGDGDPIIERLDIEVGGVGREVIGSVAIAELDGQPGAEIVAAGNKNMYAFHNDGSTYWMTDTLPARDIRGTPVIGNLDLDPEPEIVVNLQETLAVFEHDGAIAWTETLPAGVGMPLLVDMDENGTLDIVTYDIAGTVYLYDYNYGAPTLEWSTTLSSTIDFIFGGPAVADVDGQQPGGDDRPEIAITSNGRHTVLDADGSVVWSTALDPGDGGGVSIADVDGDGEIELVTGTKYDDGTGVGRLYALNADGSILWSAPAYDSTSANSQSVLDLNGDGVYEIAWNGAQYGFTIFNGVDGSILYNEPVIESLTGTEYPIFADVDNDGYAEVAVPYNDGLAVVGMDGVWGESRPVWNQHSYHVTNVNDDLTVPQSEANSWEAHNTYRTQWPERAALPTYDVTVTHTAAISGVVVLPGTFSSPPNVLADPVYGWDYTQSWEQTTVTRTFASEVTDLQPGQARLVAQGTDVQYTVPGGANSITLPPLYVSAPHIVSVEPLSQTVGAGGTAVYTVTLSNPAATADTYSLNVPGLPEEWVTLAESVAIGGSGNVTVPLTIAVPASTDPGALPFVVSAENESGGTDQAGASLAAIDALSIAVSPSEQTAAAGETVTYTLTISNYESVARTYALTASGLANVALPASVTVSANGSQSLAIQVTASQGGPHPFTVHASSDRGMASADGLLRASGSRRVGLALEPEPAIAGLGTTAVLTMTVTNLGDVLDGYDLSVDLPAGWSYALDVNGANVGSVTVPPHVFNSANVDLAVTPDTGALPGSYTITATARSQAQPAMATTIPGTVEVLERGVQVTVDPAVANLHPADTGLWQVTITNTGSVADSYWLTATGIVGLSGDFSTNPVSLNPGQAATVQLTADSLDFALPTTYLFAVAATSQDDGRVRAEATEAVTFEAAGAVQVAWQPAGQTITDTYSAVFLLVVTNTGNVNTTYQLGLDAPGLNGDLPLNEVAVPARATAVLPVSVEAAAPGTYTIEGAATAAGTGDDAQATLTVTTTSEPPTADAGPDQTADEGDEVTFSGSASDPEDGPLAIRWDFGDGASATGTLSPAHTYADDGDYVVTLTVTDEVGLSASNTLVVVVRNVAPAVDAGPDQTAEAGVAVQFSGAFTDPGVLDTHTIEWDFGDGQTAGETLAPEHVYEQAGVYTVTLTVTDDGGQGSDEVTVTVVSGERKLFMPIISRP